MYVYVCCVCDMCGVCLCVCIHMWQEYVYVCMRGMYVFFHVVCMCICVYSCVCIHACGCVYAYACMGVGGVVWTVYVCSGVYVGVVTNRI